MEIPNRPNQETLSGEIGLRRRRMGDLTRRDREILPKRNPRAPSQELEEAERERTAGPRGISSRSKAKQSTAQHGADLKEQGRIYERSWHLTHLHTHESRRRNLFRLCSAFLLNPKKKKKKSLEADAINQGSSTPSSRIAGSFWTVSGELCPLQSLLVLASVYRQD